MLGGAVDKFKVVSSWGSSWAVLRDTFQSDTRRDTISCQRLADIARVA
jgi:hypothetical protein